MLRIYLLGDLRLANDTTPVPRLATQKAASLFAYLVMHPARSHPREVLAEMLWQNRPSENARRSLHTALWQIRHALKQAALNPGDYVTASDLAIEWHASQVWLDVVEFESCIDSTNLETLQRALALYRGDFLDGLYDDWCLDERYRLQEKFLHALGRLTDLCLADRRFVDALSHARHILQIDNLREDAHRAAMRALYQLDQRAAALDQFAACAKILRAELAAEPSAETRALHQAIADEALPKQNARAVAETAARGALTPSAGSAGQRRAPYDPERIPFASRADELRQLNEWWQARREPLALILGEAGVGKTRLAHEWSAALRHRRTQVVRGRCYAFERVIPYQAIGEALRELLAATPNVTLDALPDWVIAELVHLAPELTERLSGRRPQVLPQTPRDRGARSLAGSRDPQRGHPPSHSQNQAQLFDAVARALAHLAVAQPILFIVEDLHWAAESTLALLEYLVRGAPLSQRVRWLATARQEDLDAENIAAMLPRVRRDDLVFDLPLSRLHAEAVAQWIGAWSGLGEGAKPFAQRLFRETEGNAFFITKTIESLFESGRLHDEGRGWEGAVLSEGALPFPRTARELITARVRRLPARTAEALSIAAVAGREFDLNVLRAAWGSGEEDTLNALEDLLRAQLIRESETPSGRDYEFTHDKIQETTYEQLSRARRIALHRRVGEAMETVYGETAAAELLHHYLQAGESQRAIHWGIQAGERALRLPAYSDALDYLTRAKETYERLDRAAITLETQIALYAALCHVYADLRLAGQIIPMAEQLLELAQRAHDVPHQVEARLRLGRGLSMANDPRAPAALEQARQLAKATRSPYLPEILYRLGVHWGWLGQSEKALRLFDEALAVDKRFGDQHMKVRVLISVGVVRVFMSDFGGSLAAFHQAVTEAEAIGDISNVAWALSNLSDNYVQLGLPQRARAPLQRAQEIGITSVNVDGAAQRVRGGIHHLLGEYAQAREAMQRAYELNRAVNNMDLLRVTYHNYCTLLIDMAEREQALQLAQEFYANRAAQYGDDDYLPSFTRGLVFLALGRLAEAEADLTLALQRWHSDNKPGPRLWHGYLAWGRLCAAQKRYAKANAAFARARELIRKIAQTLDNFPDVRDEFLSVALPMAADRRSGDL